jgi:CBS domain-containing protein
MQIAVRMKTYKVRDAMKRNVMSVDAGDSLSTALQLMLWAAARHLPVLEEGRLAGVLSERDILRYQAEHGGSSALSHAVARAASMPPKFAHPDDSLTEAMARMRGSKVGCLPVVVEGELVGILTVSDVLAHQVQREFVGESDAPRAGEMMTKKPVVIGATDNLDLAVERMATNGVRHLPVVDGEGRLCGILSDRDIRPFSGRRELEVTPVENAMTRVVVSLGPDARRATLIDAFTRWHLSALPIVDEEQRPIGVVSYVDLLRTLAP